MREIIVFHYQLLTVATNIKHKEQVQHYFSHVKTRI